MTDTPLSFDSLPLSAETREALAEIGYTQPTPVQAAVFEPATRGVDLVVQARTGTGKTAAFALPIVDSLVRRSLAKPQVLVLAPTRELALQITHEIERLGRRRGISCVAIYGGAPMGRQVEAIAAGAQVVVGTPGRVLDHLKRGTLDPATVQKLVLDEADEMLSMGFERELNAILERLPKQRQTLLFSATIPPDVERMARDRLRTPEFITLSSDQIGALEIGHFVYFVAGDKLESMLKIIEVENPEGAIVFCNTKAETERVAEALQAQGFAADWLNGDLPQNEREQVMSRTREGKLRFLVATDVAARGIDISHLTHVINFDFPESAERYVHRTGRTGRAGRTGTAVALITPKDIGNLYLLRLTYKIKPIEKQIPSAGELRTRAEADLVTMLAEAFAAKDHHSDDLALAQRLVTHDAVLPILAGLLRDHLGVRADSSEQAAAARRAKGPPRARPAEQKAELRREPEPGGRRMRELPAGGEAPVLPGQQPKNPPVEPSAPDDARSLGRGNPAPAGGRPMLADSNRRPAPPRHGSERRAAATQQHHSGEDMELPSYSVSGDEPKLGSGAEPKAGSGDDPKAGERRGPSRRGRTRPHATFVNWEPPAEPGDDQPIFSEAPADGPSGSEVLGGASSQSSVDARALPDTRIDAAADNFEFTEIFVNAGRRDGMTPGELQRILSEVAGVPEGRSGRVRVRERNAFVSVSRELVTQTVAALKSTTFAGKPLQAEPARVRTLAPGPNDT